MSETLEALRRSRDYQRERVGKVRIAHNRLADGLAYWRERAMAAETALDHIIGVDTIVSDGGKMHDHGPCAEIAIRTLQKSAPGFSAPHNSDECLPSSNAAEAGADTRS